MNSTIWFLLAIIGLFLIVKLFRWPLKILWKLILNGILGFILLLLVNFLGKTFGFYIGMNIATCLIAGFFGVPGVIFLIIFSIY